MDAFSFKTMGMANFNLGDFDPILFSLMGMVIVFAGLTLISVYIVLLPKLLHLPSHLKQKAQEKKTGPELPAHELQQEQEELLAIAVAFHLDQDFPEENQKITWKSHGDAESAWQATGIAHGLAVRNHVHISRRRY